MTDDHHIEKALFDWLSNLYPKTPFALDNSELDELPYVLISTDDTDQLKTTGAISSLIQATFEVECWGKNTLDTRLLSNKIIASLRDLTGVVGQLPAYDIQFTRVHNQQTGHDKGSTVYYRNFTLNISYKEVPQ
jgi:hypothetical protein